MSRTVNILPSRPYLVNNFFGCFLKDFSFIRAEFYAYMTTFGHFVQNPEQFKDTLEKKPKTYLYLYIQLCYIQIARVNIVRKVS